MSRPKIRPRSYQQTCVRRVWQAFEAGAKTALFIMAVGLGKTFTAAFLMKRWRRQIGGRILVLCHQNDVNAQNAKSIRKVLGRKVSFGNYNGDEKTTQPVDVLFASFQTIQSALEEFPPETFSLVFVDECHHGVAKTYKPVIQHFTPRLLVGMTGTIDRTDGADVTELFGTPVFRIGIAQGIAKKHLAEIDYRVELDNRQEWDTVKKFPQGVTLRSLNSRLFIPRRDEEIAKTIARHANEITRPKVKVFCSTRKHCERMAEALTAALPKLTVSFVHTGLKPDVQRERLRSFRRGETRVMVSVNKFQEGIDVPGINLLVFLRSTVSRIVFEQQLGRGLRRKARKTSVRVLDFVCSWKRLKLIDLLRRKVESADGSFTIDVGEVRFTELMQDLQEVLDAIDFWWPKERILAALEQHRELIPNPMSIRRYSAAKRRHGLRGKIPDFRTLERHRFFLAEHGWQIERMLRLFSNAEILEKLELHRDKLPTPLQLASYGKALVDHSLTDMPAFASLARRRGFLAAHGWTVKLNRRWTAQAILQRLNRHASVFAKPLILWHYKKTLKRLKLEDMPGIEAIEKHAEFLKSHGWPVAKVVRNLMSESEIVQALDRHRAHLPQKLTSAAYSSVIKRERLKGLPLFSTLRRHQALLAQHGWEVEVTRPYTWTLKAIVERLEANRAVLPNPLSGAVYGRAVEAHSLKMMPHFTTLKPYQAELEKLGWSFARWRR